MPNTKLSGLTSLGTVNDNTDTGDEMYVVQGGNSRKAQIGPKRRLLTAGTTFYVRTGGNDTTGDGSANDDAHAFATPQGAYNYIAENIDGGGNWVKVKIQDGTYTEQTTEVANVSTGSTEDAVVVIHTQLTGVGSITFEGETKGGAYFQGFGCLHNTQGFIRFKNIKFASPAVGGKRGIFARAPGAVIGIMDGCVFGPFLITDASEVAIHIYSQSICKIFSPITIAGGMHRFLYLEGAASSCDWEDITSFGAGDPWVVITGTPSIPYFVQLGGATELNMLYLTFDGTFVGQKYVNQGGYIGIYPYQHPNDLIPGTEDGTDRGANNLYIDNSTGAPPAWTPVLRFGGSSTGITFNVVKANYLEVGPMVFLHCTFNLSSKGAQTGAATIAGIPYTSANLGGILAFVGSLQLQNVTPPGANFGTVTCSIDPNSSVIGLFNQAPGSSGTAALTDAEFQNSTSIALSIMYFKTT